MQIGFIGCGSLTSCLIPELTKNYKISLLDKNIDKLNNLKNCYKVNITENYQQLMANSTVIFLAVKPKDMYKLLTDIKPLVEHSQPILISVAAGIKLSDIEQSFTKPLQILRCMPNTPSKIGRGAGGILSSKHCTNETKQLINEVMSKLGKYVWVNNDSEIDVITALSGSGPCFWYKISQGMIEAATKLGLSEEQATILTKQNILGVALMLQQQITIDELISDVKSKGGTTEKGLQSLEMGGINDLLYDCLAATKQAAFLLGDNN